MIRIVDQERKNITSYTVVVCGEEVKFDLEIEEESECKNGIIIKYYVRFDLQGGKQEECFAACIKGHRVKRQVIELAADFVHDSIEAERMEIEGVLSEDDKANLAINILSDMQDGEFFIGERSDQYVSSKDEADITTLIYDALSLAIQSLY